MAESFVSPSVHYWCLIIQSYRPPFHVQDVAYRFQQTWGTIPTYDYEECRLLGYENPVRTSQVTHYVSTTESSRLMLCKI
jgi:hypothetical protein